MRPVLLLLPLLALPLDAESRARQKEKPPAVVEEGSRVRITLLARKEEPRVGQVLALPPGSIVFSTDSTDTTLSRLDIKRLEVSRGRRSSAGGGAVIGALVGATLFAIVGLSAATAGATDNGSDDDNPAGVAILFGAGGAVVGGGLGALIGNQFHHEQWDEAKP